MEKKKIEIVPGDGKIDITPARDTIGEVNKKKPNKDEIVIPKILKDENQDK